MNPCPKEYSGYSSDLARELTSKLEAGEIQLSLGTRLRLRIVGHAKLCTTRLHLPSGRDADSDFYVVRCPNCGRIFVDYVHGFAGYFYCPYCHSRIEK